MIMTITIEVLNIKYILIIWMVTVKVSSAVYKPGHVQNESPAEHSGNKPSIFHGFTPKVYWD